MKIQKAGYHGIYFPEWNLCLDGYHPDAKFNFVSHAHADHMPRNRKAKVHATGATVELMRQRGFAGEAITLKFGEWVESDSYRFRLFPAGHILGSAMLYLESEEGSLLYTGDYRTPPSPASEGFEAPKNVDYLITEATFALPIYKWKSHDVLADQVRGFASNSLDEGYTPVFLGYNLGKAQELMHLLAPLGHPMMIHGAGYKLCSVYTRHGFDLGNFTAYNHDTCEGNILIAPSSALSNGFASNVPKKRIAYCSGWAANESRRTQLTVDKLIPLSDHLDFFELIRFCEKLSPKKVYITHTPNPDVVRHYLDELGIENGYHDLERETED